MSALPHPHTSGVEVGTFWQQPRTGRWFQVMAVEGDTVIVRHRTRSGHWNTNQRELTLAEFMRPDEDPLLDNLLGWRLAATNKTSRP